MFPTSFRSIHRLRHTMTQQKTRAVAPWQWLISLTQTQWVARTSATSWGLVFAESYLQTTWWFVKSLQQQPSTSLHSAQKPTPASASATPTGNKKIAFVQHQLHKAIWYSIPSLLEHTRVHSGGALDTRKPHCRLQTLTWRKHFPSSTVT